jgi:hypothetical protein
MGRTFIGKIMPITPMSAQEQMEEQRRLLKEDKNLDVLRELPWVRRNAYILLYVTQMGRIIDNAVRMDPDQRQKMHSFLKHIKTLLDTAPSIKELPKK